VKTVSSFDAMEFCNRRSAKDGLTPYDSLATVLDGDRARQFRGITRDIFHKYSLPAFTLMTASEMHFRSFFPILIFFKRRQLCPRSGTLDTLSRPPIKTGA
jgi:hypothetical protein